jgi:hypothetical protein
MRGPLNINRGNYVGTTKKRFLRYFAAQLVQLYSCSSLSRSEDFLKLQNRSRYDIHSLLPRERKMQTDSDGVQVLFVNEKKYIHAFIATDEIAYIDFQGVVSFCLFGM